MSPWVLSVLLFILLPAFPEPTVLPRLSVSELPQLCEWHHRGSLSVRCTYEKEDAGKEKYWCGFPCMKCISVIAKTSSTEREVTKDRVTIRDDPENLTFTVTLERLRVADAGTYACGISTFPLELKVQVVVSVFPAPKATSASPETSAEPTVFTRPKTTQKEPPDLSPSADPKPNGGGSILSSIHFRILIFLKVPVLLGMMGAVLWASWPRSTPHCLPNTPV